MSMEGGRCASGSSVGKNPQTGILGSPIRDSCQDVWDIHYYWVDTKRLSIAMRRNGSADLIFHASRWAGKRVDDAAFTVMTA